MSADIPPSTEKIFGCLFRFFVCNVVSGVESKIESKASQSIILSLSFVGAGLFSCRSEQALSSHSAVSLETRFATSQMEQKGKNNFL